MSYNYNPLQQYTPNNDWYTFDQMMNPHRVAYERPSLQRALCTAIDYLNNNPQGEIIIRHAKHPSFSVEGYDVVYTPFGNEILVPRGAALTWGGVT